MKRTSPIRKKSAPKKRPTKPCSWSNRCKRRPTVEISEDERYCKTHAAEVAWQLVRLAVMERDHWTCQRCAIQYDDGRMQGAHVISRGAPYIKFDPENVMALCQGCHMMFTLKPAQWAVWLETYRPGLYLKMVHREIEGERSGHTVDLADVIREFRQEAA